MSCHPSETVPMLHHRFGVAFRVIVVFAACFDNRASEPTDKGAPRAPPFLSFTPPLPLLPRRAPLPFRCCQFLLARSHELCLFLPAAPSLLPPLHPSLLPSFLPSSSCCRAVGSSSQEAQKRTASSKDEEWKARTRRPSCACVAACSCGGGMCFLPSRSVIDLSLAARRTSLMS